MIVDVQKVAGVIAEIAEEEILSRFGKLDKSAVRQKSSPTDLVTDADVAAEIALEKALKDIFPAAAFIGEEKAASDPSIVAALENEGAFWIVDPVDGTRNFVNGKEEFGTIIALVENGRTRQGWIYAMPERRFLLASEGDGATWDGEALPARRKAQMPAVGLRSVGWLSPEWAEQLVPHLKGNFETSAHHCSAYGYIRVARNLADFKLSSWIHAWDHAAGALIVAEAGGRTAFLEDGADYRAGVSCKAPLLSVANKAEWAPIAQKLLA